MAFGRKPKRYCSEEDCNKEHRAKGLCDYHYDKSRAKLPKNREYQNNYQRKYRKEHPEVALKGILKQLSKLGKEFDLDGYSYQKALIAWSKSVKKRDKACINCGSTTNLNAHHIIFKKSTPKLSLNINNGITLCKTCHGELHGFSIYIS